jgi:hypothetical protein
MPATSMLVDIPTEVSLGRNQFSLATGNPLQAAADETTELVTWCSGSRQG